MIALYIVGSLLLWLLVATGAGLVTGKSIRHADQLDAQQTASERSPA